MRQLAVWADCDPALLDEERVRSFFLHLKLERGWSSKSIRQARASLTAFFNGMLGLDWAVFDTIKTKDVFKLPSVLTRDEVRLILAAVREPRFRVPLRLIYECGYSQRKSGRCAYLDIYCFDSFMIFIRMLWTLLIVAAVVGLWYWYEGNWDGSLFKAAPGCVCANLNADQANAWLREHPQTQVLDVRSTGEFSEGALPKAVNISIGDEAFDAKVTALDKKTPVLVYCAGGFRSRKAVAKLKELGFENIQHIHRGYMSWKPDTQ